MAQRLLPVAAFVLAFIAGWMLRPKIDGLNGYLQSRETEPEVEKWDGHELTPDYLRKKVRAQFLIEGLYGSR